MLDHIQLTHAGLNRTGHLITGHRFEHRLILQQQLPERTFVPLLSSPKKIAGPLFIVHGGIVVQPRGQQEPSHADGSDFVLTLVCKTFRFGFL